MKSQTQLIVDMVKAVADKQQKALGDAYDLVLTWIAVRIGVEEQLYTEGISYESFKAMDEVFDENLLKSEAWDWFGEAGEHLGIFSNLPTAAEVDLKAAMVTQGKDFSQEVMPASILVGNAWTGRDLFALQKVTGSSAIFFILEPELRLYRTLLLNTHLHGMSSFALCAGADIDSTLGSENWRHSNLWNPTKESKLRRK